MVINALRVASRSGMLWVTVPVFVDKFCGNAGFGAYPQSIHRLYMIFPGLYLDDLVEYVQFVIQLRIGLAVFGNFSNGVKHSGVVTSTKRFADFWQ